MINKKYRKKEEKSQYLQQEYFLGADFKNNQPTKQLTNFIWTNRKQVKCCFYLPIGPIRIV